MFPTTSNQQTNEKVLSSVKALWDLDIPSFIGDIQFMYQAMIDNQTNESADSIIPEYHSDLVCRMFSAFKALQEIQDSIESTKQKIPSVN